MNPLAAIRQFIAPEVRAPQPREAAETGGAGAAIPASELQSLPSGATPTGATAVTSATSAASGQFSSVLGRFVNEVNGKQAAAADAAQGLMTGQNVSLHQAVIAMEEASLSFQLMVEVRNKLLESYQELMRMQV